MRKHSPDDDDDDEAMNVQKNLRLKSVRTAQVSRRSERERTRKTALFLSRDVERVHEET